LLDSDGGSLWNGFTSFFVQPYECAFLLNQFSLEEIDRPILAFHRIHESGLIAASFGKSFKMWTPKFSIRFSSIGKEQNWDMMCYRQLYRPSTQQTSRHDRYTADFVGANESLVLVFLNKKTSSFAQENRSCGIKK
jgi:hypothetical protein